MQVIKVIVLLVAHCDLSLGDQLEQLPFRNAVQKIVSALPKHDLLLSTDRPTMERRVFCGSGGGDVALVTLHEENGLRTRSVMVTQTTELNGCSDLIFLDRGEGVSVNDANHVTLEVLFYVASSKRHENVLYGFDKKYTPQGRLVLAFDKTESFQVREITLLSKERGVQFFRVPTTGTAIGSCVDRKLKYCMYFCKYFERQVSGIEWCEEPSLKNDKVHVKYTKADISMTRGTKSVSMTIDKDGCFFVLLRDSPKLQKFEYRNKRFELVGTFLLPRLMSYIAIREGESDGNMLLADGNQLVLLSTDLLPEDGGRVKDNDLRLKLPYQSDCIYAWMQGKGSIMFVSKKYPLRVGLMNV